MIYTIGLKAIYEQSLAGNPEVHKLAGGTVWPSQEAAQHYLDREDPGRGDSAHEYQVYAVDAEWEIDTQQDRDGWTSLTRDARLFRIEGPE